jgi:hypothetical protein
LRKNTISPVFGALSNWIYTGSVTFELQFSKNPHLSVARAAIKTDAQRRVNEQRWHTEQCFIIFRSRSDGGRMILNFAIRALSLARVH